MWNSHLFFKMRNWVGLLNTYSSTGFSEYTVSQLCSLTWGTGVIYGMANRSLKPFWDPTGLPLTTQSQMLFLPQLCNTNGRDQVILTCCIGWLSLSDFNNVLRLFTKISKGSWIVHTHIHALTWKVCVCLQKNSISVWNLYRKPLYYILCRHAQYRWIIDTFPPTHPH